MQGGVILLNKQRGERSTTCVNKTKLLLGKNFKVGHAGTLDSTAEGLLVILFGNMTKASSFIMGLPKVYEVEAQLGYETDTLDFSGEIVAKADAVKYVTKQDLEMCLFTMLGWINQVPPRISAVRINGKRSHLLARKGLDVVPATRVVRIYKIEMGEYNLESKLISFRVFCGKGTYIRSIVRDLGRALGCYATVVSLKRTYVGSSGAHEGVTLEQLQEGNVERYVRAPYEIIKNYTIYSIPQNLQKWVKCGNFVYPSQLLRMQWSPFGVSRHVVLVGEDFFSFAEYQIVSGKCLLKPIRTILCDREDLGKEDL